MIALDRSLDGNPGLRRFPLDTLRTATASAPHGPARRRPRAVAAEEPFRIAAFAFDLDALFDAPSLDAALVRAAAREVARERGLDPLWSEVLAVELTRADGAEKALDSLFRLWGRPSAAAATDAIFAALEAGEGIQDVLASLRRRFKLACVSGRAAGEASRILRTLEMERLFDVAAFAEAPRSGADAGAAGGLETASGSGTAPTVVHLPTLLNEPAHACVVVALRGSPTLGEARRAGLRTVSLGVRMPRRDARQEAPGPDGEAEAGLTLDCFEHVEALAAGAAAKYPDRGLWAH